METLPLVMMIENVLGRLGIKEVDVRPRGARGRRQLFLL